MFEFTLYKIKSNGDKTGSSREAQYRELSQREERDRERRRREKGDMDWIINGKKSNAPSNVKLPSSVELITWALVRFYGHGSNFSSIMVL